MWEDIQGAPVDRMWTESGCYRDLFPRRTASGFDDAEQWQTTSKIR
jgi:hypothetical protein